MSLILSEEEIAFKLQTFQRIDETVEQIEIDEESADGGETHEINEVAPDDVCEPSVSIPKRCRSCEDVKDTGDDEDEKMPKITDGPSVKLITDGFP